MESYVPLVKSYYLEVVSIDCLFSTDCLADLALADVEPDFAEGIEEHSMDLEG